MPCHSVGQHNCLCQRSIAVRRQHDRGNSYRRKDLVVGFQFQRFSSWPSRLEPDRHGTRAVAESFTSRSTGIRQGGSEAEDGMGF